MVHYHGFMATAMNKVALKKFFEFHLGRLPEPYTQLDSSRLTVVYFCVVGLDLLGALDGMDAECKRLIVEYVYAQQLPTALGHHGFLGTYQGHPFGSCLCNLMQIQCSVINDGGKQPSSSSSSSSFSPSPFVSMMILITVAIVIAIRWGWCQWTSIYGSDGPSQV